MFSQTRALGRPCLHCSAPEAPGEHHLANTGGASGGEDLRKLLRGAQGPAQGAASRVHTIRRWGLDWALVTRVDMAGVCQHLDLPAPPLAP